MQLSFGATNAKEKLAHLIQKEADFRSTPAAEEVANELATTAWSMCDWVYRDHAQRLGFTKLRDFQDHVKARCPALVVMQDIANAAKHGMVSMYTPRVTDAKVHPGDFDPRDFDKDFCLGGLQVTLDDGTTVWFENSIIEAVRYWSAMLAGLP